MTPDLRTGALGQLLRHVHAPGRALLVAAVVLVVFDLLALFVGSGTKLEFNTNVPDARVTLDGSDGQATEAGAWRFEEVPYGQRQVSVVHRDYVPHAETLSVGIIGSREFRFDLERRRVRLTIETEPGADVYLDGKPLGRAGANGTFEQPDVLAGAYQLSVRMAGYHDREFEAGLHEDANSFNVRLEMTQEKRAELALQRDRAYELLVLADTLFGRRDYQGALDMINQSIKLYPLDYRAQRLRERIVETIKILQ